MVRLARCSNNMIDIDECSNALDMTIFPKDNEKEYGSCLGTPLGNVSCKYKLEIESGMPLW